MTQEDKELLLKDLSARVPYGVLIVIQDTFKYSIVSREYHVLDVSNFSDIVCFNYKKFDKRMKRAMRERPNDIIIKPYLFPMSSMTEEQEKELTKLGVSYGEYALHDDIRGLGIMVDEAYIFFEFCYKHHIDFLGLIEMGLALDATGLNIY